MACNQLSLACQKVGRFLHDFASLEKEIDERIVDILQLKDDAAQVVANSVDFFRKLNILRTIAQATAPENEKKSVEKLFSAIAEHNNNRVLMAHSVFEPAADESVQFRRTIAKDGKVKVQDPLWSKNDFEEASAQLKKTCDGLAQLRPTLTYKVVDGRPELVNHYLFTPFSTWVPTG